MKFTASRLSEGNKIFPAEIHCESNGLTVKIPGLFSGHTKHLPYNQIGEVSVDAPLIGYSTINFFTAGTRVSAHGFTSSEVKQIKSAIEKGQQGTLATTNTSFERPERPAKTAKEIIAEAQAEKIEYELDQKRKHDNSLKPWLNDSNFKIKSAIDKITFPNDVEDIEKTVEKIIKSGIEEIKGVLGEFNTTAIQHTLGDKNFLKPYSEEFEMTEACIEKANEGIKKLKRKDDTEHPKLKNIIADLDENLSDLKEKWLPKLEERRAKKKRKNLIMVGVIIVLNIVLFGWLFLSKK